MLDDTNIPQFFWETCSRDKYMEMSTDERTGSVKYSCFGGVAGGVHFSAGLDDIVHEKEYGTVINTLMQHACEAHCPYYKKEKAHIETLGEALPKEINRVQELINLYESVPYGIIAAALMRQDIKKAQDAMIKGDLPTMIAVYQDLKEYHE